MSEATTTVQPENETADANADANAEANATAEANGQEQEQEQEKKRGRKSKPIHPAFLDEKGNRTVKVDAIPEDYSTDTYASLQEDDFNQPEIYWDWRASYYDGKAAEARQQAELCRSFDSEEQRKNAQKFARLSTQLESLAETLGKDGVDLDMIKQLMGAS